MQVLVGLETVTPEQPLVVYQKILHKNMARSTEIGVVIAVHQMEDLHHTVRYEILFISKRWYVYYIASSFLL